MTYYTDKDIFIRYLSNARIYYINKDSIPSSTFESIECYDSKNNKYILENSPTIKIYFTKGYTIKSSTCDFFIEKQTPLLLPDCKNKAPLYFSMDSVVLIKVYENFLENIFN